VIDPWPWMGSVTLRTGYGDFGMQEIWNDNNLLATYARLCEVARLFEGKPFVAGLREAGTGSGPKSKKTAFERINRVAQLAGWSHEDHEIGVLVQAPQEQPPDADPIVSMTYLIGNTVTGS
jgi:hypothetical protein